MADHDDASALTRREWAWALAILALPTLAAAAIFPTYHIDTVETVNWGRYFPLLGTPKHPPLMTWFGGIADRIPFADAWSAVLLQTLASLAGVAYLAGVARMMLAPHLRPILVVGLMVSILVGVWSLSGYALNADILQVPFWAGALYHLMKASREPARPWHWLGCGICAALAFLTKYYAAVWILALFAAFLAVPSYRARLAGYGPWLAAAIAFVLIVPHLVWMASNPAAWAYGSARMLQGMSFGGVATGMGNLVAGLVVLAAPYFSILTLDFWWRRRAIALNPRAAMADPDAAFVSLAVAVALAISVALVLAGQHYLLRFSAPLAGPFLLAWLAMLPVAASEAPPLRQRTMTICIGLWAVVYVAMAAIYLVFSEHRYAQEPARAAAAEIKREWNERFGCGPAYVLGEVRPAHSLAVYYREGVLGVPDAVLAVAQWFDETRLREEGGIVAAWTESGVPRIRGTVGADIEIREMELPLRRTFSGKTQRYWYAFLPPEGCGPAD